MTEFFPPRAANLLSRATLIALIALIGAFCASCRIFGRPPYEGIPLGPIMYCDMTAGFQRDLNDPAQRRQFYDEAFFATSLQGLVNRRAPELYLRYNQAPDDFWWDRLTEPGAWLAERNASRVTFDQLIDYYKWSDLGVVVWDERVPATSNLAATIAGVEDLLVLRYDENPQSLYQQLTSGTAAIKVVRRLMNEDGSPLFTGEGLIPGTQLPSTGSAKNDAYRWLIEHYVKTGKTNPALLGNYLDAHWLKSWKASAPQNHTLTNLDYLIANRGAVFDLNVWEDETPIDDRGQAPGTDLETLKLLLRACYDRFGGDGVIHVAGFVPWAYKYTDHKSPAWDAGGRHAPVPTEWKYAEVLSCYNAYMDADALGYSAMANASIFSQYRLPPRIPQNPRPTRETLSARGILDASGRIVPRNYYAHYQGDYDAAAWLYWKMPEFWPAAERGAVPMTWAFNPNLAQRFAFGMHWLRQTRTPNDFFIAGDSGAGYLNPFHLSEPREYSGLPSGVAAWERHCRKFYEQWDISATGFIIDGNTPGMTPEVWDAYARFSPDGLIPQRSRQPRGLHHGAPYLRMYGDLTQGVKQDARIIHSNFVTDRPHFVFYRSILKHPKYYADLDREITTLGGPPSQLVDLYTLMYLVKEYETNRDAYARASPYAAARELSARPGAARGLGARQVADGPFTVEERDGHSCWIAPASERGTYLYFNVNDDFAQKLTGAVEIEYVFLDQGQGVVQLHYDSTDATAPVDGAYKPAAPPLARQNTGEWRRVTHRLPDPHFQNRQNGLTASASTPTAPPSPSAKSPSGGCRLGQSAASPRKSSKHSVLTLNQESRYRHQ